MLAQGDPCTRSVCGCSAGTAPGPGQGVVCRAGAHLPAGTLCGPARVRQRKLLGAGCELFAGIHYHVEVNAWSAPGESTAGHKTQATCRTLRACTCLAIGLNVSQFCLSTYALPFSVKWLTSNITSNFCVYALPEYLHGLNSKFNAALSTYSDINSDPLALGCTPHLHMDSRLC